MKFHNRLDVQTFLAEIGKIEEAMTVSDKYSPTNEELKTFMSQRSPLIRTIKNHRQSTVQKNNWRENRFKIMRGIKSFHKSVDGKRLHRKMGRFLATRLTKDKTSTEESFNDKHEALTGLNSLKQHLIVELGYFHKLYEQVELEEMILDYAFPMLADIEKKILSGQDLSDDETTFIMDMINHNTLLDSISELTGIAFEKLKEWCDTINIDLEKDGISTESPEYVVQLLRGLILSSKEKHV